MGVNKVEVNGETIINLENDTVTPDTLAEGVTAHNASGDRIVGKAKSDVIGADKVKGIDTAMDVVTNLQLTDTGVWWNNSFVFVNDNEEQITSGDILQNIPIVAGENVTFEVDNTNKYHPLVKVNAEVDTSNLATVDKIANMEQNQYVTGVSYGETFGIGILNKTRLRDSDDRIVSEVDFDQFVPIIAGDGIEFEKDEEKELIKIKAKGGSADTSNLATVDKIKSIDTWAKGVSDLNTDDGICWREGFQLSDAEELSGNELALGDIYHRIPIKAGNGIEFELEESGEFVKINATGGGSKVYTVSSADKLPSDAPDGSIAIVNVTDESTIWEMNNELPNLGDSYNAWADNDCKSPFEILFSSNGSDYNGEYTGFTIGTQGSSSWGIYALYFTAPTWQSCTYNHNPSGNYGISHGWNEEGYRTINVSYADEEALKWLEAHATQIGSGEGSIILSQSLYAKENGEWVFKSQIGTNNTPNTDTDTSGGNYITKYVVELTGSEMVSDIIAKLQETYPDYQLGVWGLVEFTGAKSGLYGLTINHYGGNIYNISGADFSTFYTMANSVTDWSQVSMWSFTSMFQPPVPYCDESMEGQVLKVVNGVPTWTTL